MRPSFGRGKSANGLDFDALVSHIKLGVSAAKEVHTPRSSFRKLRDKANEIFHSFKFQMLVAFLLIANFSVNCYESEMNEVCMHTKFWAKKHWHMEIQVCLYVNVSLIIPALLWLCFLPLFAAANAPCFLPLPFYSASSIQLTRIQFLMSGDGGAIATRKWLDTLDFFFTSIFTIEIIWNFIAHPFVDFIRDGWSVFDSFVVFTSLVYIVLCSLCHQIFIRSFICVHFARLKIDSSSWT